MDKRKDNNPHITAEAKGAEDAKAGKPLHECPYRAPQFKHSWLRGYAREKQLSLF